MMTEKQRRMREALSSILADVSFRPMEKKLLVVLADGECHWMGDLIKVMEDSQASMGTLSKHIYNIKGKIAHLNHTIICEFANKRRHYRYVILLSSLAKSNA